MGAESLVVRSRLRSLVLTSVPFAGGVLVLAFLAHWSASAMLVLCGLIVAIVAGSTKVCSP